MFGMNLYTVIIDISLALEASRYRMRKLREAGDRPRAPGHSPAGGALSHRPSGSMESTTETAISGMESPERTSHYPSKVGSMKKNKVSPAEGVSPR
jgi:hypothetical protein